MDPASRRSVLIGLTAHGRRLIDKVVAAHVEREHELLDLLSARDREQLAAILRRLLIGLGDEDRSGIEKRGSASRD